MSLLPPWSLSGSSCVGNTPPFQDHLVLDNSVLLATAEKQGAAYFKTPANRSRAGFEPCATSVLGTTAWTWLHLRRAMVRPGRDRLSGRVEVDYLGALEEGVRGRQPDAIALIAVAAEEDAQASDEFGCARFRRLRGQLDGLRRRVGRTRQRGPHRQLAGLRATRKRRLSPRGELPGRATGAGLGTAPPRSSRGVVAKRWILGTHQGAVRRASRLLPRRIHLPHSTAASEVEASSSTAWCSRPSLSRCPTSRWSLAPQYMLRTTTTCRGYFKIPESSEYPSHLVLDNSVLLATAEKQVTMNGPMASN